MVLEQRLRSRPSTAGHRMSDIIAREGDIGRPGDHHMDTHRDVTVNVYVNQTYLDGTEANVRVLLFNPGAKGKGDRCTRSRRIQSIVAPTATVEEGGRRTRSRRIQLNATPITTVEEGDYRNCHLRIQSNDALTVVEEGGASDVLQLDPATAARRHSGGRPPLPPREGL